MQETQLWSLVKKIPSGEGNGNPLQCSCLWNPMDRGAWWAIVHGVTKELDMTSQQWLLISHNNNTKVIHEPWSGDWLGLTVLFCFHWIYFYGYYIFKANGINFSLMVLILILPFKLMSLGITSKLIQRKNIK